MIDINDKNILREVNMKIVKQGNCYNAFLFDVKTSEWKALLPDYTLLTSVLGALESELGHVASRLA